MALIRYRGIGEPEDIAGAELARLRRCGLHMVGATLFIDGRTILYPLRGVRLTLALGALLGALLGRHFVLDRFVRRLNEAMCRRLPSLYELLGLFLKLLRPDLMHFPERPTVDELLRNHNVLIDPPVHEIGPLLLCRCHVLVERIIGLRHQGQQEGS